MLFRSAGGKVAWTWFASRAQKTGYEVAVYNLPHVLAQSIALDADYGLDTLEPIANFGADPAVLAERLPAMFHDEGVLRRMREGGASMRIMGREEVQTLWQRHQAALEALLADLGE